MKRARQALAGLTLLWLAGVLAWVWTGPEQDPASRGDYALVLGAAVDDDGPTPVFQARIDHAISLWREGRVEQILFTGGLGEGDSLSEAEAARAYAITQGVPAEVILLEDQSRTTMENLVFAQPGNLGIEGGSILVVTDPLHMRRAMAMAQDLGWEAAPSATPLTRYRSLSTQMPFALREVWFLHHYWLFGE